MYVLLAMNDALTLLDFIAHAAHNTQYTSKTYTRGYILNNTSKNELLYMSSLVCGASL